MSDREPNLLKKELRSTFWLTSIQGTRVLGALIVGVVVIRYLGASDYGALMLATSLSGIFSAFATLGLPRVLFNELVVTKRPARTLFASAMTLLVLSGLLGVLGTYFVCLFLDQPRDITIMALLISFAFIFNGGILAQQVFLSNHSVDRSAAAQIGGMFISILYRLIAVYTKASVVWFSLASIVQNLCVLIISIWLARPTLHTLSGRLLPQMAEMKHLLVITTPLFLASLLQSIPMHSDRIFLGAYLSNVDLAKYAVALQLVMIPQLVVSSIVGGASPRLVPLLQNCSASNSSIVIETLAAATSLSVVSLTLLTIFGATVMPVIYGPEFEISRIVFGLICLGSLANVPNTLRFEFLLARKMERIATKIACAHATSGVLIQYVFITKFGLSGAAAAYAIQWILYSIVLNMAIPELRQYQRIYWKSMASGLTLLPLGRYIMSHARKDYTP